MKTEFGLLLSVVVTVHIARSARPPSLTVDMKVDHTNGVEYILRSVSNFMDTFIGSVSSYANAVWQENNITRRMGDTDEKPGKPRGPLSAFSYDLLGILVTYHPKDLQILLKKLKHVLRKYNEHSAVGQAEPNHAAYEGGLRVYIDKRIDMCIESPLRCQMRMVRERGANQTSMRTYLTALDGYYTDVSDQRKLNKTLKEISDKPTKNTIKSFINHLVIQKYKSLNDTARYGVNSATSILTASLVQATTVYIRFFDARRSQGGMTVTVNKDEIRYFRHSLEKVLDNSEEHANATTKSPS